MSYGFYGAFGLLSTFPFQPLKVGAGGFITGINVANDGSVAIRTDTFGGYIWDGTKYQQLATTSRLPIAQQATLTASSCYELQQAPNNSNVIYFFYGQADGTGIAPWLMVSTNKGNTFVNCSNWTIVKGDGGGSATPSSTLRAYGPKGAVDPANADDFLFTMQDGKTYETLNGTSGATATFAQKTTVPTGTVDTVGCVAFDPTSGTTGSPARTNVAYVSSWGSGLYMRTTPTGSFSLITGTSAMQIMRVKVHIDGTVYFLTGDAGPTNLAWHRLTWSAGPGSTPTVTTISPPNISADIALDPNNSSHVTCFTSQNGIYHSINQGTSWSSPITGSNFTLDATAAPYLKTGDVGGASDLGGGRFTPVATDPSSSKIILGAWQAPWTTTYPINVGGTQAFALSVNGIEQIASNAIIMPANTSKPILCTQDWGVMLSQGPNSPPLAQGWKNSGSVFGLSGCWHADYASDGSSTVVALVNSPDGGNSVAATSASNGDLPWTQMANVGALGDPYGSIAAADSLHFIQMGNGDCYRTADAGATAWTKIVNPAGVTIASNDGWSSSSTVLRRMVAADRVNIGTFYLWNGNHGLFSSTDFGVTWANFNNYNGSTLPSTMGVDPNAHGSMKSVPGNVGNLFFCTWGGSGGSYTGPNPSSRFWRSTDGGQHWTIVGPSSATATGAIVEVWAFDTGASAPGQTYPAIYIYGWMYNGTIYEQGVYRSIDNAVTWTKLAGAYPDGWTDQIQDLAADKLIYGRVGLAKHGSGFSIGQYN